MHLTSILFYLAFLASVISYFGILPSSQASSLASYLASSPQIPSAFLLGIISDNGYPVMPVILSGSISRIG
ncbi:hypothetical protein N7447_009869 [Penicillium robsamsonii]|uniref:uncharacterized protein n=1 Tax=Penicillium robsamsonii TaxID=1792511 RepID=UPI0025473D91|nr:uncharacterized protein N7447_009869 [Penicillium robsamsonii]KAJ5812846.1 hypothetical protein N7447_009869 [Penicillium robsamsonii]